MYGKNYGRFAPRVTARPIDIDPIAEHFDRAALTRYCELEPAALAATLDMEEVEVDQRDPNNHYWFKDNGSSVLAVAHLDTVCQDRTANIMDTADGPVIFSGALDDRLGAYVVGDLLPRLGLTYDLLYTVGEEDGESTAAFFNPADHHERQYDWIIEFDRGGTDVVLYQYEDDDLIERVEATGTYVNQGAFSDISFLEHLNTKAMNWGVGYQGDYHGPRAHAWLNDTFKMVGHYLLFHMDNKGKHLPHEYEVVAPWWEGGSTTAYPEYEAYANEDDTCDMTD